jgi:hypothetical protein
MQIAAYARAPYALIGDQIVEKPKVDGASIVMLAEDGYLVNKIDVALEYEGFLAALALWKNQRRERK